MGAWGYLPFQNDSILDDLGGFLNPLRIKNALESALNCEYYYGSYEVAALLSCTYEQGITDKYIIVKEETYNLLKLLNKEKLTNSDRQLLCESNMAWISACAMDLQSRQDMLTKSCTQLYQLIHNPKLTSHYPDKDKEELINNMKLVYKTAKKIIDDGFPKPIFIPNIMYNKLENNYKKLRNINYVLTGILYLAFLYILILRFTGSIALYVLSAIGFILYIPLPIVFHIIYFIISLKSYDLDKKSLIINIVQFSISLLMILIFFVFLT